MKTKRSTGRGLHVLIRMHPRALRSIALAAVMTIAALAQTATELESPEVNRVAAKLNCDCGCKLNMACKMPPDGRCPVCQRNKAKILSMQKAGMSDEQILAQYVKEMGKGVLVVEPGTGGFVGPYIALGLGFLAVLWTIRRYMHMRPATAGGPNVDPETLAKIEKETANLD
jgi:cytochrome c-type biogenesis protein CcmH/NrfF